MMFLEELTEDLINKHGLAGLGELTLVFPTRRAALVVNECIRRHLETMGISRPVQAPMMTTLSGLFDSLSMLGQEDELRLVSKLYDVYCRITGLNPPLDVFYGWGRQLIQDFSMLDKSAPDVMPEEFLKHAAAARKLEELELDEDVRQRLEALVAVNVKDGGNGKSTRRSYEQLWEQLPVIYAEFQSVAGERTYEGARMKEVLHDWDTDFVQAQLRGRKFVFAGFNYLVPVELELMRRLQKEGQAVFYWDYPSSGSFSCNPKAFKWIQQNAEQKICANELQPGKWEQKEVELVTTSSVHAEAQFVWQWLKEHHHTGERTGIVLCDETMLEQVIAALPDVEAEDPQRFARINITKGFPLKYTPIFAFVTGWLSDENNDRREGETWGGVMRRLLDEVSKYGGQEVAADMEETARAEEEREDAAEEVKEDWSVLLGREAHYQMMLALNRFSGMAESELEGKLRSQSALRLLLRRYLEGISLPFHGEPLMDIQVIGVLETRAMDFDNLLILNVEEGVVPQVSEDLSYFPFYLRKAYGMQTTEESTDVYAYNFFRLMRRARLVTLTYCGSESKNNRKTMSRFVMQMLASSDFKVRKVALNEPNDMRAAYCFEAGKGEEKSLSGLLHVGDKGLLCRADGSVMRLSPSALNCYKTCPMRFYLTYIEGVRHEEEREEVLSRAEVGLLVHQTIECLYKHLNGGKIDGAMRVSRAMLEGVSDELLSRMLDEAYVTLNEEINRQREGHVVENEVVLQYVRNILEADKLAADKGLEIMELESDCSFVLDVDGVGKVRIGGRADRIDRVGGVVRIVDYKTSSAEAGKLRISNGEAEESMKELFVRSEKTGYQLQTLVYAEAYIAKNERNKAETGLRGDVMPVIYFVRESGEDVAQSVRVGSEPLQYGKVRGAFLKELERFVSELLQDTKHERAEEGHCDPYCEFYMLCDRQKKEF